jgi:hypothetical protein
MNIDMFDEYWSRRMKRRRRYESWRSLVNGRRAIEGVSKHQGNCRRTPTVHYDDSSTVG